MRISIPSIPNTSSRPSIERTINEATDMIGAFLEKGGNRNLIMTGAGISVDSGIAPYRGKGGHYTVHKTYRPIFFEEFSDKTSRGDAFRRRYWARSFLGFKPVQHALPNPGHYSIAALQRLGHVPSYITQNVDNLHHAATPSASLAAESILELHGTLQGVVCVGAHPTYVHGSPPVDPELYAKLSPASTSSAPQPRPYNTPTGSAYPQGCGFRGSRSAYQDVLEETNPRWHAYAQEMRAKKTEPRTNPDGDVQLGDGVDYQSFRYANCPQCGGSMMKPAVIFFGEGVPPQLRDRSFQLVEGATSMLLVGTSLATYSAFRLVKTAVERGTPCLILNIGPTRADDIVEDKIELGSSEVLRAVATKLAKGREARDPVLRGLLEGGKVVTKEERMAAGNVSS